MRLKMLTHSKKLQVFNHAVQVFYLPSLVRSCKEKIVQFRVALNSKNFCYSLEKPVRSVWVMSCNSFYSDVVLELYDYLKPRCTGKTIKQYKIDS